MSGLDEIRIALEQYRSTGLTEKNRKLIRQIAQSDVWREVVRLPQRLMAEARINAKTKPYRAAVTAQLAIAILILIRAPVRMQNLASIRIGINLIRPGGPGAPYMLVFPDYDVKNGVPLEFAFDEATTALIDEYIYQHRPHLMQGFNHDWLFAGAGRGAQRHQDPIGTDLGAALEGTRAGDNATSVPPCRRLHHAQGGSRQL